MKPLSSIDGSTTLTHFDFELIFKIFKGDQGFKGERGDQGEQGLQGSQGPPGETIRIVYSQEYIYMIDI